MDEAEIAAVRRIARVVWDAREQLGLPAADLDAVLTIWMAVGTPAEGEAAASLLAARAEADRRQVNFDRVLKSATP